MNLYGKNAQNFRYSFFEIIAVFIILLMMYYNFQRDDRLASMLNFETPPKSLKGIDCESPFSTDVLKTCQIEIETSEFNLLLSGYEFEHRKIDGTSHTVVGPNIGKEFKIIEEFSIEPQEFKSGGFIKNFR